MPVSSGNVYLHESILSDQYPYRCGLRVKARRGIINNLTIRPVRRPRSMQASTHFDKLGFPRLSSDQNRACRVRHILISPEIFSYSMIDHKQAVEEEQTHAVSPVEKEESSQRQPLRHHGVRGLRSPWSYLFRHQPAPSINCFSLQSARYRAISVGDSS